MPIYEYTCPQCNNKFEVFCKIKDIKSSKECPECKNKKCKKIISNSSFILSGTGWARDNYNKK
jgi:putative FmdB family regulatory protein